MFTLYSPSNTHIHQAPVLEIVENGADYLDMSVLATWKVIVTGTRREVFNALINLSLNWDATVNVNYANGDYKILALRTIRGN